MSTEDERGADRGALLQEGRLHVPLLARRRPVFTTTEDAIAYVRDVVAEIGPWPEVVEVVEASSLEGRTSRVLPNGETPQARKMHEIGGAVRRLLAQLEMMVRMPQLALVAGDYADLLWDSAYSYRVAGEEEMSARETMRDVILGLLRQAGNQGINATDLWGQFVAATHDGAARLITRDAFLAHLRLLQKDQLACQDYVGRWFISNVTTEKG
jgi:hypothetical protein